MPRIPLRRHDEGNRDSSRGCGKIHAREFIREIGRDKFGSNGNGMGGIEANTLGSHAVGVVAKRGNVAFMVARGIRMS